MSLVKGPFEAQIGSSVLAGIEEVDFEYDVDTDTVDTIQGRSYEIPKTHKVSVTFTFVETDVPSLAVVLPQYYVAPAGTLSSGETVGEGGAIDIVPGECGDVADLDDVLISGCGDNPGVLRILDCASEIEGIDFEDTVRKINVKLTGNSNAATVQLFAQDSVTIAS